MEITRRLQRAWACFQRCKMEIYGRPGARLRLKVRLLKAEVIDTLLCGCMTWSPSTPDCDRLRRVHHSMLLRCLRWRKRKHDNHTLSYADALAKTASESVEAIVPKRRILLAGLAARTRNVYHRGSCFGELFRGKGYSGGQEKDWVVHLKEDMSAFGMRFERRRKDAQKTGRCLRRVEERAGSFMRKWHDTERCRAAERHAKTAAALFTIGISKWPG